MSHLPPTDPIPDDELERHFCLRSVDKVPRDPETTAFKRRARLHQALWREARGYPIGAQPMTSKVEKNRLGSRLECRFGFQSPAKNFLGDEVRDAVKHRLANPERDQTLNRMRLMCDLLSSMPMCFNLFGWLHGDLEAADRAIHRWWPETPGRVTAVHFEWSPDRRAEGKFLENRSAFDVAFELKLDDGTPGVIGIETKYHEHCRREAMPPEHRRRRYEMVADNSGVFRPGAAGRILGSPLQQIWLDHLLALSMLQHTTRPWTWTRFLLVHPEKNPSFERAAEEYQSELVAFDTFKVATIESLLDNTALPEASIALFRERYLW